MKTIYTILFLLISTSYTLAQKVNYESSKWFWGFNIGSTRSSTDLKDENYNGFGLTLGRSFNYDYGKALSFDLRGRFLAGQWYGQGTDYTTLGSSVNPALQSYLIGNQNYVHNFRTDVRELDLELVLHAGKLRERTGFDPYVFGGLGLTWQQNWTDALDTSGLIYDYNAMAAAGPLTEQLPGVLDNMYETRLDGLMNNSWQVNWMPSLGFGLAYHRGRFSIGLEHKTTFTMADSFDGIQDQTARLRNDWYHYTSAIVQIHLKQRNPQPRPVGVNPRPNPVPNTVPNNQSNSNPCPTPEVQTFFPPQNAVTVSTIKIEFTVAFINGAQDLVLLNSFNQSIPFNYNSFSSRVEALVNLNPGINNFTLRATTPCGTDQQTIQINRENCQRPAIQITNNGGNNTVTQAAYNFIATVSGQVNSNQIQVIHNGMSVLGFNFNTANGQLQRLINLAPGSNIIRVEASNACGNAAEQITITNQNCVAPSITILSPAINGTVQSSAFRLRVNTAHIGNRAMIQLKVNGVQQSAFTFNNANGLLEFNTELNEGLNTFFLNGTNECGTDTEVFNVTYTPAQAPCNPPQVYYNMIASGSTVNEPVFTYYANIVNYTANSNIVLSINGTVLNGYSNVNGSLAAELGLIEGNNQITITVSNDCGRFSNTYTVFYLNNGNTGGQNRPTNPLPPSKPTPTQSNPKPVPIKPTTTPTKPVTPKPKPTNTAPKPAAPKTNTTPTKPAVNQTSKPTKTNPGTQKSDTLKTAPNTTTSPQKTKEIKTEKGGGR